MADAERKERLLLVEDEESLAVGLTYNLNEEGYAVIWASDGQKAIELFDSQDIDLVILDIMLPRVDGFAVAEHIRARSPQMPILMLTARTTAADRIRGLETGADDYLAKPFHLEELLLRIRGMLKRKNWYSKSLGAAKRYNFVDIEIDFLLLKAKTSSGEIRITPLEGMLLRYLTSNPSRIVTRRELLENVWRSTSDIETRTVDNFLMRLRKYFEPDPSRPIYFRSVRGAGYFFSPDGSKP